MAVGERQDSTHTLVHDDRKDDDEREAWSHHQGEIGGNRGSHRYQMMRLGCHGNQMFLGELTRIGLRLVRLVLVVPNVADGQLSGAGVFKIEQHHAHGVTGDALRDAGLHDVHHGGRLMARENRLANRRQRLQHVKLLIEFIRHAVERIG